MYGILQNPAERGQPLEATGWKQREGFAFLIFFFEARLFLSSFQNKKRD